MEFIAFLLILLIAIFLVLSEIFEFRAPANVDRVALGRIELRYDFVLGRSQLAGHVLESRGKFSAFALGRECLRPIHGKVEVTAAVVQLVYFSTGRFFVVEF